MSINKRFAISSDNSYLDVVNNIKNELKSMDIIYKTVQIVVKYKGLNVSDFDVIKSDVIEMAYSDEIKENLKNLFECRKNEEEINANAKKIIVMLNDMVEWIKKTVSNHPEMEDFFNINELSIVRNKFEFNYKGW